MSSDYDEGTDITVKELIEELEWLEPDLPVLCQENGEQKQACMSFFSRDGGEPFAVGVSAAE